MRKEGRGIETSLRQERRRVRRVRKLWLNTALCRQERTVHEGEEQTGVTRDTWEMA